MNNILQTKSIKLHQNIHIGGYFRCILFLKGEQSFALVGFIAAGLAGHCGKNNVLIYDSLPVLALNFAST